MNRKTDATEITCKRLKIAWVTLSLKQRRLAMALKSVFAFSVFFLFSYCEAKPENCSETRCKLLPVGEGFASEFRSKAFEKGVRLVYLNLIIGNDSYDPLELQDEFLPHRWVWASKISEHMLTLPDDYDILSLSLLNYQVRSMDVQLEDQPSGCLANLNSTCQNIAVGRMLLENVTMDSSDVPSHKTKVVCVAVIKTDGYGGHELDGYHCCGSHKGPNGPSILCNLTVANSKWVGLVNGIVITITLFMTIFIPALPLALPDWFFSLQNECDKENGFEQQNSTGMTGQQNNSETADKLKNTDQQNTGQTEKRRLLGTPNNAEGFADNNEQDEPNHSQNGCNQRQEELSKMIPVDDPSPVTFSNLFLGFVETLPDLGLSFNIKLAIMWLCVYPCVFYVQFGLYRTLKKTYINEIIKKHLSVWAVFNRLFLIVTFDERELGPLNIFLVVSFIFSGLIPVLFSRPEDFILDKEIICCMCREYSEKEENKLVFPSLDRRSVGDEIRCHLKILHHYLCDFFLLSKELAVCDCSDCFPCTCRTTRQASRLMHAIWVLLRLVSIPFILLLRVLWGAFAFIIFLGLSLAVILSCSPYATLLMIFFLKVGRLGDYLENFPLCVMILGCALFAIFWVFYVIALSFANFVTLFNLCNCIINTVVYLTMGVVLNLRIVTPFVAFFLVVTTNIYLCYANMQNKYKEVKKMILKWRKEKQINNSDPEGTIRIQLFWFVCDRVLPIRSEICRMFRNMVLILTFLFLAVYSIAVFGNEYNVSVVFSTIYVFFSGAIAALVFKGLTKGYKFIGWTKIKIEREVEKAVTEYHDTNSPVTDVRPESADNLCV